LIYLRGLQARSCGKFRALEPSKSLTPLRAQQIELFEGYHARVRVVYLETAWEEELRRNAKRPQAVPEDVIDHMLGRLEPPERFEAQAVAWLCV